MEKKTYHFLTLWFFLLNLFDAIMTIHLVTGIQVAEEINPIMDKLIKLGPWSVFFSTKMLVGGLFCYGILKFREKSPSWTKWSLIISLLLYNAALLKHSLIALHLLNGQ